MECKADRVKVLLDQVLPSPLSVLDGEVHE
jgi:hypothetical protein